MLLFEQQIHGEMIPKPDPERYVLDLSQPSPTASELDLRFMLANRVPIPTHCIMQLDGTPPDPIVSSQYAQYTQVPAEAIDPEVNCQVRIHGGNVEVTSSSGIQLGDQERETLKKIVKTAADRQGHCERIEQPTSSSHLSEEDEIQQFFCKYLLRDDKARKDIPVKELRHIIPMLILHCYGMKGEPTQKKVKGLWERPPGDWPFHVPYCDPNNAPQKAKYGDSQGSKPKKETLVKMFNFLIHKYSLTSGQNCAHYPIQDNQVNGHESSNSCPSPNFATEPECNQAYPYNGSPVSTTMPPGMHASMPSTMPTSIPAPLPASVHLSKSTSMPTVPPIIHTSMFQSLPTSMATSLPISTVSMPTTMPTLVPTTIPNTMCVSPPDCINSTRRSPVQEVVSTVTDGQEAMDIDQPSDVPIELTVSSSNSYPPTLKKRILHEYNNPVHAETEIKDELEIMDWNPVSDLLCRVKSKVAFIENMKIITDVGLLSIIRDLLVKMRPLLREHHQDFLAEKLHDFECTLDLIYMKKQIPESHRMRWLDFEAKWYLKVVGLSNGVNSSVSHS